MTFVKDTIIFERVQESFQNGTEALTVRVGRERDVDLQCLLSSNQVSYAAHAARDRLLLHVLRFYHPRGLQRA